MKKLIAGAAKLGLSVDSRQLEQFYIYYHELLDWNKKVNLTAITDYEEVQIKHFLDSITLTIAWKSIRIPDSNLIDIGTGAGMPGIPLRIMFPDIKLVLLDSVTKKASFLYHLKDKLKLDDVEIVVGRAEEIAHKSEYRESFDMVLSRAVATLPTLVELTLPFCRVGGSFITQKKGAITPEISQAARAISQLGGKLQELIRVELDEFTDERQLIIINKISHTPRQYPRHPGIPAKRPILEK